MENFFIFVVFSALLCVFKPTGAFPQPGFGSGGSRRGRDASCRDDLEYPHGSVCCLNCPAGKHVKSPCTRAGTMGTCGECPIRTFTEHANGFQQCFPCSTCRPDQEIVRICSATQNTECQCRLGRFCDPDHACEVCKKCSKCGSDEEIVRNCTATTNTECKKIQPKSGAATESDVGIGVTVVCVLAVLLLCGLIFFVIYKKRRGTGSERNLPERMKADKGYSEVSRDSSTNLIPPRQLEDEQFPTLVPVNGEESLKRCFEFFEELDVDHHKRFFRHLGFSDNVIKSKESLPYEDRVHELLNMWIEREGKDASLNDLMAALLNLNQRRTAEMVKEKAVHHCHYLCES
ncbi:tumor necrosis factor receptor superfamily member 10B-like isoform 2-T2 [Odontesthes bonariensis]|uniref:tumor necrosis factor receptor superfamily member 10B-like isoform X2 n=1 Tax=Odontesthes bonariensis TaxID=219752 RepID=UPI003F580C48